MKIIFTVLFLVVFTSALNAQTYEDVCHVYVVDVEKATKVLNNDAKPSDDLQKIFPEFRIEPSEEKLTTKHYPFPNSKLIITASVYYTDESMASHPYGKYEDISDSITIGIVISGKPLADALSSNAPNSAITEVTYDDYTNMVRAKQYVKAGGKLYLVGIECVCAAKRQSKKAGSE